MFLFLSPCYQLDYILFYAFFSCVYFQIIKSCIGWTTNISSVCRICFR